MMSLSPAFVGFAILAHGGSIVIGLLFALVGAALTTLCLVYRTDSTSSWRFPPPLCPMSLACRGSLYFWRMLVYS